MNKICTTIFQVYFFTILTVFVFYSIAQGATQITGTVTAKRAGSVKIEFKPHKTAGPQSGDLVDFKTMIQGMEVNAGQGEVTESETNFAWVKITKGRPNLKMAAIIHATGEPGPVEYTFAVKGSSDADEMYNIAAAELKVKLQAGLVFNSFTSTKFKSQFYLDEEEQVFGNIYLGKLYGQALTDSRPFLKEHTRYTQVMFEQGGMLSRKADVIWENRMLTGAVSKCIASRAAVRIIIDGKERYSHQFYATCRAAVSPAMPHHIEPLFGFELSISFPKDKDPGGDYWEKQFLHAIQSLSIEFQRMKNIKKREPGLLHLSILVAFVSILLALQTAYGMTNITGTVTAKRADSVKVKFEPHETAGPKNGDLVDFETMIQGMEVNAGQGEVTESGSNFIWVKITKGKPNLKMTATLQATGSPISDDASEAEVPQDSVTSATEVGRETESPANIPEVKTAEEIFASRDTLLLILSTSKV